MAFENCKPSTNPIMTTNRSGPIKPLSTKPENGNGTPEPETTRRRTGNKPEPKEPDDLGN